MTDDATLFEIPAEPARTRRTHPGRHLASKHPRGIRATWCAGCREPVLRGLNDDEAAGVVMVDYAPLTVLGEVAAWQAGRPTLELRRVAGVHQLQRRNHLTIRSRPPGTRIWCGPIDVVAEHRCRSAPLATQASVHPPATTRKERDDDQPPF